MSLSEQIEKDYLRAYKARDEELIKVLRILKSELKNASIAKKDKLSNEDTITVLKRQIKQREDAIEIYDKNGKKDIVAIEKKEIEIINKYLPTQLSEKQIVQLVKKAIEKLGVKDISQIGSVISEVMSSHRDEVSGSLVSKVARELLK